ncbi:hypothetical protein CJU89_5976 [Yarrowia sp. B02]|nr:hypothetical protein CJU89_5976 [Yarrowia sp. B02]
MESSGGPPSGHKSHQMLHINKILHSQRSETGSASQHPPQRLSSRPPPIRPPPSLRDRFSIAQNPGGLRAAPLNPQRKRDSPDYDRPVRDAPRHRTPVRPFGPTNKHLATISKRHKTNQEAPAVVEIGATGSRVSARPYSQKEPQVGIPERVGSLGSTLIHRFKAPTSVLEINDTSEDEDLFPAKRPDPESSDEERPLKTRLEKALQREREEKEKKEKKEEERRKRKLKKREYTRPRPDDRLKPAPLERFLKSKSRPEPQIELPASFAVQEMYLEGQTWTQDLTDLKLEGGKKANQLVMDVTYVKSIARQVCLRPCAFKRDRRITVYLDEIHRVKYHEPSRVLVFSGILSQNVLDDGTFFEDVAVKLESSEHVQLFLKYLPGSWINMDDETAKQQLLAMGGEREDNERRLQAVKAEITRKEEEQIVKDQEREGREENDKDCTEKDKDCTEDKEKEDRDWTDDTDKGEKDKDYTETDKDSGEPALPRRSTRLSAAKKPAFPDFGDTHHYQTKSGKQMEITAKDVEQLRECEYLNDTLISLFLQIEHDKLPEKPDEETAMKRYEAALALHADKPGRMPEQMFFNPLSYSNTYVFSTYFVHKLQTLDQKTPQEKYQLMKKWTSKIDLFSKQCVIIPIVEHNHWYVMVLWNLAAAHKWRGRKHEDVAPAHKVAKELTELDRSSPARITRSQAKARDSSTETEKVGESSADDMEEEGEEKKPRLKKRPLDDDECIWMFALDSLNITHRTTAGKIFDYIQLEAKERLKIDVPPLAFKSRDAPVPIQTNTWDCGVYLIHFVQMFLANPSRYLPAMAHLPHNKPKTKSDFRRMWSTKDHILLKRDELVKCVFGLKEGAAKAGNKLVTSDVGEETPDDDDSDDDVMITSSVNHSPAPRAKDEESEEKQDVKKGEAKEDKGKEDKGKEVDMMEVDQTTEIKESNESRMDVDVETPETPEIEEIQSMPAADTSIMDVDEFDFDETPRKDSVKHGLLRNALDRLKPEVAPKRKKEKWKRVSIFDRPARG